MNTPNNPDRRTGTLEVEGKAAVVTGAASGIGLAIVRELANAGAKVIAADLRKDVVSVFEKEPPKTGSLVQPILADVSVESDVERMIGECQSRFGQVDILINNAGLGGVVGSLTEISLKDWRDTFAVLVEGVLSGMKHAGRAMISQGTGGSIVNMASVAGLNGGIGPLGYSSAKAAVISMTQNAAVELAANRIRVNAICPGAIFTPMFSGDGAAKAVSVAQPWPDQGQPEQVAELARFLCSDSSNFITGQAYVIDGGLMAAGTRFQGLVGVMPTQSVFVGIRNDEPSTSPKASSET